MWVTCPFSDWIHIWDVILAKIWVTRLRCLIAPPSRFACPLVLICRSSFGYFYVRIIYLFEYLIQPNISFSLLSSTIFSRWSPLLPATALISKGELVSTHVVIASSKWQLDIAGAPLSGRFRLLSFFWTVLLLLLLPPNQYFLPHSLFVSSSPNTY